LKSLDQFAESVASELAIDAVGMWQVVPYAQKDFGSDEKLVEQAIRYCLVHMFGVGALPVVAAHDGLHRWAVKTGYGETHEQMADAIVSEWKASGAILPRPYDSLWFALPAIYRERN
jgi:hypothetical protein